MADELFRVSFFVKDKDLARAKRLLVGIAIDMHDEPVVNAKMNPKAAQAKEPEIIAETTGSALELFQRHLKKRKPDTYSSAEAAKYLQAIGLSPGSASYLMRQAQDAGLLIPAEKHGHYKVVK